MLEEYNATLIMLKNQKRIYLKKLNNANDQEKINIINNIISIDQSIKEYYLNLEECKK